MSTAQKKLASLRVFLSSTSKDLAAHRQRCRDILTGLRDQLGIECVAMELFGTHPSSPKDHCLEQVRRSHLYVGIFGTRYGHIDPQSGKSITELEYLEANAAKLPCLIYIIDDDARVNVKDVETGPGALKLEELKKSLRDLTKGHIVGKFNSADDLAASLSVGIVGAVDMARQGADLGGLRARIDEAIEAGVRFISEMENRSTGGWCYYEVGGSSCWDTAYSLLALVASGEKGLAPQLHRGHHRLMGLRSGYGGWRSSWESNPDASTTVDTAIALLALSESGYEEKPWEIARSADYLLRAQQPCGGWSYTIGSGSPVTAATAWAVRALLKVGLSPASEAARRALHWLINNRRYDGGWGVDQRCDFSTIGKTRDALMALWLFGPGEADAAVQEGRDWLLRARTSFSSSEDFAKGIGIEPQGVNPLVENIVYFLEGAFYAKVPAGDEAIKNDLEWLSMRPSWSHTPLAVWCLSQYRKWIT